MDKVNSIFPLPSEWIGNFKEGWYRDNNISSKKELDEIWQERVRTIDQIYKYQRIAFEKKFAEWQQSQQPEPIEDIELEKLAENSITNFPFKGSLEQFAKDVFISGYKAALQQKGNNNLPEQQGKELLEWVMASEQDLPEREHKKIISILYKSVPNIIICLDNKWYWLDKNGGKKYPVNKDSLSEIEWLKPVKAKEQKDNESDVKNILREFIMRANYAFPMTEQDLEWFEAGTDAKTDDGRDFLLRLFDISGLEAEARKDEM